VSAELCGVRAEQLGSAIQRFSPVEVERAWQSVEMRTACGELGFKLNHWKLRHLRRTWFARVHAVVDLGVDPLVDLVDLGAQRFGIELRSRDRRRAER
jgi:hypothetical protein